MFPDTKLFALNIEMLRLSFESYRLRNHHLKPHSFTTIKSCKEGILKELIQTLQWTYFRNHQAEFEINMKILKGLNKYRIYLLRAYSLNVILKKLRFKKMQYNDSFMCIVVVQCTICFLMIIRSRQRVHSVQGWIGHPN